MLYPTKLHPPMSNVMKLSRISHIKRDGLVDIKILVSSSQIIQGLDFLNGYKPTKTKVNYIECGSTK